MSFWKKYIHHRNVLRFGQAETGILYLLIITGSAVGTFLKTVLGLSSGLVVYITVSGIIITCVCQYLWGKFYDKKGLIHMDYDWHTKRTPVFKELLKRKEGENDN